MVDICDSETGVSKPGSRTEELVALARRYGERAQHRGVSKTSDSTRQSSYPVGDLLVQRALRIGLVPEVYRTADWGQVRSPAVQQWTSLVEARIRPPGMKNWRLLGHGLLILGPVGTGKSSSAALACRAAAEHGFSVRWEYVPDLLDAVTESAAKRRIALKWHSSVDLMVWDDFGVRQMAEWEVGYLDQLVEARYRKRLPMVVTSNLTASSLRSDPTLQRLVDRWRERTASQVVVLSGESMRSAAG